MKRPSKLHALIGLVAAAWLLNAVSPGSGDILMLGAFVLWFVAGDGFAQFKIAWDRFLKWLPG